MKGGRCAQCGTEIATTGRGRPRRYCGRACQARAYRARKDGDRPRHRTPQAAPVSRRELDRPTIVRDAIALADADGLDAVSMRALAARSGVAAMTLYRHVSGKDDLVSAMVDAVFAQRRQPDAPGGDWRARLAHEARLEWELYRRHPWTLQVLATMRPPLARGVLASVDRCMTALTDEGLDADTALPVYLLVSGYVQGAALLEVAESKALRDTGVSSASWWSAQLRRQAGAVGSGRYPWLTELATTGPMHWPDRTDLRSWFDFGLQRVLDGVAAFLSASATGHDAAARHVSGHVAQQQARAQQAEQAHARSGEPDADQSGQTGHGDRSDGLPEIAGEAPGAEERGRAGLRRQVGAQRHQDSAAGAVGQRQADRDDRERGHVGHREQGQVPDGQSHHRRHGGPGAAEAVHDLA
ncbi:TetR/AcrR family transcriptional regulator [Saccharopolyspora sp. 5N708]|uniref:TetR/AcrR family transcriptional regulator n=1 Tax=Saccharopolyspora sp. 5N708 TaxID=3457424 RepID=UPI003FD40EB1